MYITTILFKNSEIGSIISLLPILLLAQVIQCEKPVKLRNGKYNNFIQIINLNQQLSKNEQLASSNQNSNNTRLNNYKVPKFSFNKNYLSDKTSRTTTLPVPLQTNQQQESNDYLDYEPQSIDANQIDQTYNSQDSSLDYLFTLYNDIKFWRDVFITVGAIITVIGVTLNTLCIIIFYNSNLFNNSSFPYYVYVLSIIDTLNLIFR